MEWQELVVPQSVAFLIYMCNLILNVCLFLCCSISLTRRRRRRRRLLQCYVLSNRQTLYTSQNRRKNTQSSIQKIKFIIFHCISIKSVNARFYARANRFDHRLMYKSKARARQQREIVYERVREGKHKILFMALTNQSRYLECCSYLKHLQQMLSACSPQTTS